MFDIKYIFYLILLYLIVGTPQINLYYTNWISNSNKVLQHDCLRIAAFIEQAHVARQIISYCLDEFTTEIQIENENFSAKFTFNELSKENITSQQLYLWSAPIDLIEDYQFYLNQLSIENDSLLAEKYFYNCTLPRFGSMCQYEFYNSHFNHTSLYEIIRHFYSTYTYDSTNMTCYTHLQCYRGPSAICLHWSEICDGNLNCLDSKSDEEHCWQLNINQCQNDEYQCANGQCIPQAFYGDHEHVPDCLDGTDEFRGTYSPSKYSCLEWEPSFECEDITCDDTPFMNDCEQYRRLQFNKAILSIKDKFVSDHCWFAFNCTVYTNELKPSICNEFCRNRDMCIDIIKYQCPDMIYISVDPNFPYPVICSNHSRYDNYFLSGSKIFIDNKTCYRAIDPYAQKINISSFYNDDIQKYNGSFNHIFIKCNRSNMYQCINILQCIHIRHLMDVGWDCPYGDDENLTIHKHIAIEELPNDASPSIYELKAKLRYIRRHISFQTICDGFTELIRQNLTGQYETDESECEEWPCNNMYTHCDHIWNCFNGEDELDCNFLSPLNCSSKQHLCISPDTNQFICLSIEQANDGNVDCLGGFDEPNLCRPMYPLTEHSNFYCRNQTSSSSLSSCLPSRRLCNGIQDCLHRNDDEQFCDKNATFDKFLGTCDQFHLRSASDVVKFICNFTTFHRKQDRKYFSLDGLTKTAENQWMVIIFSDSPIIKISNQYERRCHRGIDLYSWLNNSKSNIVCLCPPSYYGNQCQYQNQRISLVIRFRALSDSWQTLFSIIILLINNNERIIHSYEQFTYLSVRDCKIKFNIYLIYSTRPKNETKDYFIHIGIYEKVKLIHRKSVLLPVQFSFLPVHRLSYIIDIPSNDNNTFQSNFNNKCVNGIYIKYSNHPNNLSFCQCHQNWSGEYCDIKVPCTCASDSLCLGISVHNRSICICPMNKFGSRCLLNETICGIKNNLTCENDGQCIPNDDYMVSNQKFTCICRQGFFGDRCQFIDKKIILSFNKNVIPSESIFIHFIEIIQNQPPIRATTFRTISPQQDSTIIHWSRPFHLVFIEFLDKNYYLTFIEKNYNRSEIIRKTIHPSDRCRNLSELLNKSIIEFHLLRRIKYYHLPCQIYSPNLQCFYDDIHICLCYTYFNEKRLANCFEFEHNMKFNCMGQSVCQNAGQCIQDHPECPTRSMCICSPCFYGRYCQLSTSRFGLSLDAILGYHILPNVSINNQSLIIKISLVLTIIFVLAGLINGILSLITFNDKIICKVGCGLYLLGSSITSLLTMIMFGLKFLILLLSQMTIIENRSFLLFQCHSMDFIVRVCLNMDQWLNACIAIERAMTATKGVHFDKKKSKQTAKYVILILLIIIIGTCVHDPIYRQLIDEENHDNDDYQKRTWCIVKYPSNFEFYNSIIHIFQFFCPFLINLISAIILITKKSHQQTAVHQQQTYREHLREQCRQHQNLLTAPILLIILAIPRLIIAFVSKCMKSANDSWLFLIGYFISFIPSMLTFLIFIFPSKIYRKQFKKTIISYRTRIQQCLHLRS